MKFGQVENPDGLDFTIPKDHPATIELLKKNKNDRAFEVYVGCAKWNRSDLKGFYPRGTKDELSYYATQFNSIELNATFYKMPGREQVIEWKNKTGDDFKFFPKISSTISQYRRLNNIEEPLTRYCDAISHFENKLGMVFLQMIDNFKPKDFDRVENFVKLYPKGFPLAIEVRHPDWFLDPEVSEKLSRLLEDNNITNILVDTAGRRDMLHMRLTTPRAFIRYVGANHSSDYSRLDDWIERIKHWRENGLQSLYFFVHQNVELESPLLAAYFIKRINEEFGLDLKIPETGK